MGIQPRNDDNSETKMFNNRRIQRNMKGQENENTKKGKKRKTLSGRKEV